MYKLPEPAYLNSFYAESDVLVHLGLYGEPVGMMSKNQDFVYTISILDYCISKVREDRNFEKVYPIDVDDKFKIHHLQGGNGDDFMTSVSSKYLYQLSNLVVNDQFVYIMEIVMSCITFLHKKALP